MRYFQIVWSLFLIFITFGCWGLHDPRVEPASLETRINQVLLEALESNDPVLRVHALESLAEVPSLDVVPRIRKHLYDPVPAVRFAAAVAVGDIKDHAARDLLFRLLRDNNIPVQLAAAYGLEKLGDPRFVDWFDNVLYSDDIQLAGQACILLGKLGESEIRTDSREKLWQVVRQADNDPTVRLQAAEALARLGDEAILKELLFFANSLYADDRILAISGLQYIKGNDVFAMLVVLADDPQIEVKLAAIRALGERADAGHIQTVREALAFNDPDDNPFTAVRVRSLALLALGRVGKEEDGPRLRNALEDESRYIRVAAARGATDFIKRMRAAETARQMYK
ncbi:MAG: HEAT repeat domain-containing protein [Sedimentisphaerales bacterium]|nr:HEAT repeat domain-containing protein [Sedimentisphaerales bacterium]